MKFSQSTTIQNPLSKELDEQIEEFQLSSGHQLTENAPELQLADLHLAALRGDLETVRFVADNKPRNPLHKNEYGDTALHIAALGGSLNVLKYFVDEKNCNPACVGSQGRTPLHVAAANAHLDVVKYLVTEQQIEPLCQDDDRVTPLHLSCACGCLSIVKFLTEEIEKYRPMKDLMPFLTTKKMNTPLHLVCTEWPHRHTSIFYH